MVARIARFEGLDISRVENDIPDVESIVTPMLEGLEGYRGVLNMWDPDGRMVTVTLFETEADAEAARPIFEDEMPAKLGAYFEGWRGRRVEAGVYAASVRMP